MTRRRSTALAAAAVTFALATGLSACAPQGEDASAELHASVVQVAERAASGDYAGAIAELDLLEAEVADAAEDGSLDAAREQEILDAMGLVRTDLEAAEAATTPAPSEPADESEDSGDEGPGNSGENNGDDKGKGKGNDKGKGKDD
ncbi:hypothetical protein [Agromyces salentinus]|uniref:Mucin-associated surface protein n=1 Tax=Agromyces salentinus TaxID=269421 RepID=A0ABP4YW14_9MICO|nr:hypothetical protein [Agromyces salentinus]